MRGGRTKLQVAADRFDCELFKLIEEARDREWWDVMMKLKSARPQVRMMMHPNDCEGTA